MTHLEKVKAEFDKYVVSNKSPIHKTALSPPTWATSTHNSGLSWYGSDKPFTELRDQIRDKTIIDIGVDANAACITFDDLSMLEISPMMKECSISEINALNLLNGSKLGDIVLHDVRSLMSDWIGVMTLHGSRGMEVRFKIHSTLHHHVPFTIDLKEPNAVCKQTPPV